MGANHGCEPAELMGGGPAPLREVKPVGVWKALDLAFGNGAHQSRLSVTVPATETVAVTALTLR